MYTRITSVMDLEERAAASEISFPKLLTANTFALAAFEKAILKNATIIEPWFVEQWQQTPAPITTSIDLRHAGFKLAPVDTNLFPAGFNNLHPHLLQLCSEALRAFVISVRPACQRILILPESHTRNSFYLQSLFVLQECLTLAGFEVRIGSLDPDLTLSTECFTEDGSVLLIEPLVREGLRVKVEDFDPCILFLNHDLSSGVPSILSHLEQPIYPTAQLGWSNRLKSSHFDFYEKVTEEFAEVIGIDTWFVNPYSYGVDGIDFMQQTGLSELARVVDELIVRIQARYDQYGICDKPFVVVKADNGTYGMSVMSVYAGHELLSLNRKQRTRMSARKGSQKVTHLLVQEGVYSVERMSNQAVSEPVIYLIGSYVVGGFYRVHHAREMHESLNTPGMYFEALDFSAPSFEPYDSIRTLIAANRFYIYGVVARLATLAAARESAAIG